MIFITFYFNYEGNYFLVCTLQNYMKVFQRFNIRARPSVCWWLCRSTNGIIVIENYNPDLTEKNPLTLQ